MFRQLKIGEIENLSEEEFEKYKDQKAYSEERKESKPIVTVVTRKKGFLNRLLFGT